MGHGKGTVCCSDCGAVVMFLRGCPDDAAGCVLCACGAEMVPVTGADAQRVVESTRPARSA